MGAAAQAMGASTEWQQGAAGSCPFLEPSLLLRLFTHSLLHGEDRLACASPRHDDQPLCDCSLFAKSFNGYKLAMTLLKNPWKMQGLHTTLSPSHFAEGSSC